ATEVGVREIIPVLSSRVIVRADGEQWEAKRRRWQQIAIEAARQSRRTLVPNVTEPVSVDEIASRCGSNGRWLLLDPSPQAIYSLSAALDAENDVGIIVGPEGDFDAAEKALLRDAGALPVSLGPRILRAETTAVVACAIVLYLLGDMQ
ncbi:MAG: 16S rRNA (uracil(1498)-N(3))-methyltransferase, partial [Armatimonadetes bacterium]|nr:16S rRNA (uracil(1498)-N(3))-methyltransferase [Armatimonadota bacterium]